MSKADTLVKDFKMILENRVNDLTPEMQSAYGYGYTLGYLTMLAENYPQVLQDLQDRVEFMKL